MENNGRVCWYSIKLKLITMVKGIKGMYERSKCAVVDGSVSYEWFDIRIKG